MPTYAPPQGSVRAIFAIYLAILAATVLIAVNQVDLHDWGFLSWLLLVAIGLSVLIALYGLVTGRVWSVVDPWTRERIRRTRRGAWFSVLLFSALVIVQVISGIVGSWDVEETLVTGIFVGLTVYMAGMYAWSGQALRRYSGASA